MKKFGKFITVTTMAWLGLSATAAQAAGPERVTIGNSWQMTRLFAPSGTALKQEAQGSIVIYEGIRDVDVERAMDEQFDRVEHMMFVGTVVTDEEGEAVVDPESGQAVTEDDGC